MKRIILLSVFLIYVFSACSSNSNILATTLIATNRFTYPISTQPILYSNYLTLNTFNQIYPGYNIGISFTHRNGGT